MADTKPINVTSAPTDNSSQAIKTEKKKASEIPAAADAQPVAAPARVPVSATAPASTGTLDEAKNASSSGGTQAHDGSRDRKAMPTNSRDGAPQSSSDSGRHTAAKSISSILVEPKASSGSSRASYVPQFSAATQMILTRMRGQSGGLPSAPATPISSQGTYESVKKQMLFDSSKFATVTTSVFPSSTTPATLHLPSSSTPKRPTRPTVALTNKKRKRGADESSEASSIAEASDYGEGIKRKVRKPSASNTPTTTKSGRHIQKPDTYDPAAEDNYKKRNQLGKRTAEQALCKKCTRMHSPATNQIVFCDGCNDPWHQRCHEPWIEDEVVKEPDLKWFCARCAAKRERLHTKKKVVEQQPALGPWPKSTAQEKRAFLTKLPPAQLVDLLMHAIDLHPELPIFPVESTPAQRGSFAGASTEGLFSRSDADPTSRVNYIRKIPAHAKKSTIAKARSGPGSLQSKAAAQAQSSRSSGHQLLPEEEDASFTKLWPKPGMGMYSRLMPDEDDDSQLVDATDNNSFSVIVFDERGKKVEENGVKV